MYVIGKFDSFTQLIEYNTNVFGNVDEAENAITSEAYFVEKENETNGNWEDVNGRRVYVVRGCESGKNRCVCWFMDEVPNHDDIREMF